MALWSSPEVPARSCLPGVPGLERITPQGLLGRCGQGPGFHCPGQGCLTACPTLSHPLCSEEAGKSGGSPYSWGSAMTLHSLCSADPRNPCRWERSPTLWPQLVVRWAQPSPSCRKSARARSSMGPEGLTHAMSFLSVPLPSPWEGHLPRWGREGSPLGEPSFREAGLLADNLSGWRTLGHWEIQAPDVARPASTGHSTLFCCC